MNDRIDMPQDTIEHEPRQVETFVVLDLDRTLLNTDAINDALCRQLVHHGTEPLEAEADIEHIRDQFGNNFSVKDYLESKYGAENVAKANADLLELAAEGELREQLLYEGGSREILDMLDAINVPFGVLTYGDEENQAFKLRLFRLLVDRDEEYLPATVTTEKYKGDWIHHTWLDEAGYLVPEEFTHSTDIYTTNIIICDDKPDNLVSPSDAVTGILIDNRNKNEGTYSLKDVVEEIRRGASLHDLAA